MCETVPPPGSPRRAVGGAPPGGETHAGAGQRLARRNDPATRRIVVALDAEGVALAARAEVAHDRDRAADRDRGDREADQRATRADLAREVDRTVADAAREMSGAVAEAPRDVTAAITDG